MLEHDRPPLSEVQLEIMQAVWDRGEAIVAEVWETVSARRKVARSTVQTLMMRLEEKGWLRHRAVGKTFYYSASRPKECALKEMLRKLVKNAFNDSVESLVLALVEDRGLSGEEARRLRKVIQKAEEEGK